MGYALCGIGQAPFRGAGRAILEGEETEGSTTVPQPGTAVPEIKDEGLLNLANTYRRKAAGQEGAQARRAEGVRVRTGEVARAEGHHFDCAT